MTNFSTARTRRFCVLEQWERCCAAAA